MTAYQLMKEINKLKNKGITHLNKRDVDYLLGTPDETMQCKLEYIGCYVERVADLFNVELPEKKFTREQLKEQKWRSELMYW